jgi:hypothetical protein
MVAKARAAAQLRAEKLAKALKACRAKPAAKRKGCEVAARKRYGAKTSAATKSSGRGK